MIFFGGSRLPNGHFHHPPFHGRGICTSALQGAHLLNLVWGVKEWLHSAWFLAGVKPRPAGENICWDFLALARIWVAHAEPLARSVSWLLILLLWLRLFSPASAVPVLLQLYPELPSCLLSSRGGASGTHTQGDSCFFTR